MSNFHDWSHGCTGHICGLMVCSVRILKCHNDRTKKIATENSPFLFMTVSEDGTVRQHDLRRPHRCPTDCPSPLFRAPIGVDLYSLSVSPVAPHTFAVAGRTDTVSCLYRCEALAQLNVRHSYVIEEWSRDRILVGETKLWDLDKFTVFVVWACLMKSGKVSRHKGSGGECLRVKGTLHVSK